MPSIRIPTPLRAYAGNNQVVVVNGATVGEALKDLTVQFPELETHLFAEGKLRSFVNIFIGEEDVRYLDGVDTAIEAQDELAIIPSIAGGHTGL